MPGNLPVLLAFGQIALGNSLVDWLTNNRFRKPGIVDKFGARRALQQPKTIHKELKGFIVITHVTLAFQVTSLHITAWVTGFGGAQDPAAREGDFTVGTAANTQIVAKAPVVQIMLALITGFGIGRRFVLLIARGG